MGCSLMPCRPGPAQHQAGPCSCRAKNTGFGPGLGEVRRFDSYGAWDVTKAATTYVQLPVDFVFFFFLFLRAFDNVELNQNGS